MVHPTVLEAAGVDAHDYQGFAFGIGLDRLAMLAYGIDDLRMMFENDVMFLKQF
jgi:phenylalanyl-tRNA synthetase alpha chain